MPGTIYQCVLLPHQPGTQNQTGTACTQGQKSLPFLLPYAEIFQTGYFRGASGEAQNAEYETEC